jgi:signal transduction histidine kinase
MDNEVTKTAQTLLLKRYAWGLATGWTLVVGLLLTLNVRNERQQAAETALTQARSNFQRDVIYRHWNAKYGPVYVPVGKGVAPNPYLAGTPDRDITTTKGKVLTLVNPAYMTRLVYELAARDYGVKGHVTSLRPVRPENSPDAWEAEALKTFLQDRDEVHSLELVEGALYLRMMKPLVTGKECLPCHQKHGYRAGEIRGGISVAVPMEPLYRIAEKNILVSSLSFTFLWLVGIGGIMTGASQLRRTMAERYRAEQEISRLNQSLLARKEELESANRELEAFGYTVAHDLRSPLTTIGGFCNLIQGLPAEKHLEKCPRYTARISRQILHMDKLIRTLLDFSRLTGIEPKRQTVDLSALAREISEELRRTDRERSVTFQIGEHITVPGDPALLRIVMQNLLANAWKFTVAQKESRIVVGAMQQDQEQVIFVKDNGAGFPREKAGRIFEAFQRLHSEKEFSGTGIGLATVKRIIIRHNGRVWAEGDTGRGATIYFTLPALS